MYGGHLRMPRTEMERLAHSTGTPLPWRPSPPPSGPEREPLPAALADALATLAAPEVLVEVDVCVRRGHGASGLAQLHSWQRLGRDRVATLSAATPETVALGWCPADRWPALLARTVTVAPLEDGPPPVAPLDLPHELLVGGCAYLRLRRPDLLGELTSRYAGLAGSEVVRELPRLAAAVGRLRATVAGRGRSGERRVGWLSWMLYADGWRSLTPYVRAGVPMVHIAAATPERFGADVVRLARTARG